MTDKLSERLRDGAASLAENWGFADHAALHSEAADALDAQAARIEVLEAEIARLNKMPVNRDFASLHNETRLLREALRPFVKDKNPPTRPVLHRPKPGFTDPYAPLAPASLIVDFARVEVPLDHYKFARTALGDKDD